VRRNAEKWRVREMGSSGDATCSVRSPLITRRLHFCRVPEYSAVVALHRDGKRQRCAEAFGISMRKTLFHLARRASWMGSLLRAGGPPSSCPAAGSSSAIGSCGFIVGPTPIANVCSTNSEKFGTATV